MELEHLPSPIPNSVSIPPALVRIDDVFKIYRAGDDETVALRGTSLDLAEGEFVALLGRSGSGKSTLLHIIAGLDVPSAGRVFIEGRDIGRLGEEERSEVRSSTIGIVLQRDNLIPYLSAAENVALPLKLAGRPGADTRSSDLLARVGLADRASHRPGQLSGGEQQRVSIAVALAAAPKLLVGDEVTGELDSETAGAILDLLVDLQQRENMALLVVTHDPDVAKRAQRIVRMSDGKISDHE
jgi:putative ABC transport system ATP-binding protein